MKKYRRTTLIAMGCISVLLGLGLSRKINIQPEIWWLAFSPLLILLKTKNFTSLMMVILLSLGLGIWRGGARLININDLQGYASENVVVQGVAKTDSIYGKKSQITFEINKITLLQPSQKPLIGTFGVSGFGVPMVYRGDMVRVQGKLFLTRGSKQANISYAKIQTVAIGNDGFAKVRRYFAAGMQTTLPEPAASLGLGLLIGQRSTLPADVLAAMTTVGLVHIVAVSGYNVTILARAVQRLKITRSKFQKLFLALSLILIFIIITGFSASVVRAAIVSTLSLWAWYYGRVVKPLILILFVAALTAMINPIYIWSDIGWYLSFLAFFGVLVVAPLIGKRFLGAGFDSKTFTMLVIESFSAQIMTVPLIMMIFGRVSIVSLPANLLVVPFIPFAMLFSAAAGVFGALAAPLAGWFSWPAIFLLTYIVDITRLAAKAPYANVFSSLGAAATVAAYLAIGLLVAGLYRHQKPKNAIVTDKETILKESYIK